MLPSFLKFIEHSEESGVSSPQHELGEESLTLNKVIEKRIKEISNEFKTKGIATEEQVLASFEYNLKKMMGGSPASSQNKQQAQNTQQPTQQNQQPTQQNTIQ